MTQARPVIYQLPQECLPWRFALRTPSYDPAFVAALRAQIPSRHKKWHRKRGEWWIKQQSIEAVLRLVEAHFGPVIHGGLMRDRSSPTGAAPSDTKGVSDRRQSVANW